MRATPLLSSSCSSSQTGWVSVSAAKAISEVALFWSKGSACASRFQEEKTYATGYTSSIVYRRVHSLSRHLLKNPSILPGEVRPVCRRKSCPAATGLQRDLPRFRQFHDPSFRVLPQHVRRLY